MTIDKAIEILTYWETDLYKWNDADTSSAIKLGIKALEEKLSREKREQK